MSRLYALWPLIMEADRDRLDFGGTLVPTGMDARTLERRAKQKHHMFLSSSFPRALDWTNSEPIRQSQDNCPLSFDCMRLTVAGHNLIAPIGWSWIAARNGGRASKHLLGRFMFCQLFFKCATAWGIDPKNRLDSMNRLASSFWFYCILKVEPIKLEAAGFISKVSFGISPNCKIVFFFLEFSFCRQTFVDVWETWLGRRKKI